MRTFNDSKGRPWSVVIDYDSLKRVKTELAYNLMRADIFGTMEALAEDPVLLCDVLYQVCKPQTESREIDHKDFVRAITGAAREQGMRALLLEVTDFFQSPRQQKMTRELLEGAWALAEKTSPMANAAVEKLFAKIGKAVEAELTGTLNPSSSALPDTSASTPVPEPSANST